MPVLTRKPVNAPSDTSPGPFLAKIVSHLDPTYMGILEVQLLHAVGNDPNREGQLHQVRYLSPFYGVTSVNHVNKEPDDYNNTQKSYGMWMIPPDVGTIVMVIFVNGDPKQGYWIGCVQDDNMNFMVPGYAATKYAVEDTKQSADKPERVPVAEYNKLAKTTVQDITQYTKPVTPFELTLETQGLLKDDIRGITTSSARREVPSAVFGISTPGPIDKNPGAKQGDFGKYEHKVTGAFVSRLGGSSFVMDDGDDKFLRKTTPSEGPMEYAAVEQNETDGNVNIPHNEMIRLRTRTGHQILLHNSEDLIYIGNARGTSWIQMSSDGKIDIFAEDSISVRTKQDINFLADRDVNIEALRNFNIKVGGEMHTHVIGDSILIVDSNQKIHVKKAVDETIDKTYKIHVKDAVDQLYDSTLKLKVTGATDEKFEASFKCSVASGADITHTGGSRLTVSGTFDLKTSASNNFTAGANTNILSGGTHVETAGTIHMNGPGAASAASAAAPGSAVAAELPKPLKTHGLADETGAKFVSSIMRRAPTHEPYPHHENLDPLKVKPEKTDRDAEGRYEGETATMEQPAKTWKEYSTKTDTFEKLSSS